MCVYEFKVNVSMTEVVTSGPNGSTKVTNQPNLKEVTVWWT